MTSYERVLNTLNRKPVDQCPVMIGPWEETEDTISMRDGNGAVLRKHKGSIRNNLGIC